MLASGWTAELDDLVPLIHPTLRPADLRQGELGAVGDAIVAYHGGDLSAVDDVPVRQRSGAFLEHAWDVLRTVPAGAPVTYTEYAAKAGRPAAVRAAAAACARNAAALFVPCHRVVRTDGSLGGFRWGLAREAGAAGPRARLQRRRADHPFGAPRRNCRGPGAP